MAATLWAHFPVSGVETWLWLPPLVAFVLSFFSSKVGISGAFLLMPYANTPYRIKEIPMSSVLGSRGRQPHPRSRP